MFAWDIGWWFCCLNDREKVVLRTTAEALVVVAFVGIPTSLWNGFWLLFGGNGGAAREAFLHSYRLEIVTIPLEGEDVSVVRPVSGEELTWASWALFAVTPEASCIDGCTQSKLPE